MARRQPVSTTSRRPARVLELSRFAGIASLSVGLVLAGCQCSEQQRDPGAGPATTQAATGDVAHWLDCNALELSWTDFRSRLTVLVLSGSARTELVDQIPGWYEGSLKALPLQADPAKAARARYLSALRKAKQDLSVRQVELLAHAKKEAARGNEIHDDDLAAELLAKLGPIQHGPHEAICKSSTRPASARDQAANCSELATGSYRVLFARLSELPDQEQQRRSELRVIEAATLGKASPRFDGLLKSFPNARDVAGKGWSAVEAFDRKLEELQEFLNKSCPAPSPVASLPKSFVQAPATSAPPH